MTPPETDLTEHEVRVAARPETVFTYFTDPAKLTQWMGTQATLDPRPGGICRIAFDPSAARVAALAGEAPVSGPVGVMSGEFIEVDPPNHISFSWGWEDEPLQVPPRSSLVEVSLTPDGDETLVRLVHRRLPSAALDFHRAGWEHYLARLATLGAGEDPGRDPWQGEGGET